MRCEAVPFMGGAGRLNRQSSCSGRSTRCAGTAPPGTCAAVCSLVVVWPNRGAPRTWHGRRSSLTSHDHVRWVLEDEERQPFTPRFGGRACRSLDTIIREFLMLYQDLWYLAFALALVPSALLLRLISLPAIRPCPVAVEVHPSSVPGGRSRSTTQP